MQEWILSPPFLQHRPLHRPGPSVKHWMWITGTKSQIICLGNWNEVPTHWIFLHELGQELRDHLIRWSSLPGLHRTRRIRLNKILPQVQISDTSNSNSAVTETRKRKRCQSCWKKKLTRLNKYVSHGYTQYLCLQHYCFIWPDCCNIQDTDRDLHCSNTDY